MRPIILDHTRSIRINFFLSLKIALHHSVVYNRCYFANFNWDSLCFTVRDSFEAILRQTRLGYFYKHVYIVWIWEFSDILFVICGDIFFSNQSLRKINLSSRLVVILVFHIALIFHNFPDSSGWHMSSNVLFQLGFFCSSNQGLTDLFS